MNADKPTLILGESGLPIAAVYPPGQPADPALHAQLLRNREEDRRLRYERDMAFAEYLRVTAEPKPEPNQVVGFISMFLVILLLNLGAYLLALSMHPR